MPGVAALVVRWCRHAIVRQPPLPVRLSFQLRAVAGGALLRVDLPAEREIDRRWRLAAACEQACR
jgi:hypothetical protein